MKFFAAGTLALGATASAYSLDVMPQFLGAALGAFVAIMVKNERQKLMILIDDALEKHVKRYHKEN